MRVIVIGAGLGGLTLAQGLSRAGIDVSVYERDGENGRPQGISLHLDDRGRSALQACLPPDSAAIAEATMGGPREQALRLSEVDGELAVVGSTPLDGQERRTRRGRQASRPLLRAVLLNGLEEAVTFEAEFTRFEQQPDGTVRAWFADGRTDTADVLVGADGVGSAVRRQYLPEVQVLDSGRRMLMGATPLRAIADTGLEDLIGDSASSVLADGKMTMALGVLRFAQPPVEARDHWLPSLHCSAVDDAEDYVMWAMPTTQELVLAAQSPAEVWGVARDLAAGLHPTLRRVIDEAWPDVTFPHRIGMIPPMRAWPASPVTLIGDAIHVAPGFGGNLAMQDAHRLREVLVQVTCEEYDLPSAIGAYEEAMRRDNFPAGEADSDRPRQMVGSR